jgi:DNA topoisomerase-1
LARIRALAIPPAYEQVWICPLENGHIQATGCDARGRKQYRYHARWREVRDENKYARLLDFARELPRIRAAVRRDLRLPGTSREKILATVVAMLESTTIRIGNQEYARDNGSFGLTTLRNRHVRVRGESIQFFFQGKSGIRHSVGLRDRRIARIVRACQDLPGQQLFEYTDADQTVRKVDSADVNAYLRESREATLRLRTFVRGRARSRLPRLWLRWTRLRPKASATLASSKPSSTSPDC